MKFWQSLAFVEMDQMLALAKFCEELGFYGVSYGDHLVTTKQQLDDYQYGQEGNIYWNPDTHWPDPWVLTAALAQATTTLNFLSTVYILPLRDPFTAAKALSTAACLSDDRISLGVGVGWQKAEYDMVGQNFHNRGQRADEQLAIISALMSGQLTEFHGKFYDFPPLKMSPGIVKKMPILVGGYAPAAMRRAAEHDGWMGTSHEEQEIYPLLTQLQEVRVNHGSAAKPFEIWCGVKNPAPGSHQRLQEAGLTMTNGTNFLTENGRTTVSSIDSKKRKLEQFATMFIR